MSLTLTDVRRIAAEVAGGENPPLDVVAATPGGDDATYAEVLLVVRGCHVEPCRVLIGVSRDSSESECRRVVAERLREHLAQPRVNATR